MYNFYLNKIMELYIFFILIHLYLYINFFSYVFLTADCAFDQCIAAGADDPALANEWITECQGIVTTEEEEIINTIQVPCKQQ